MPAYEVMSYSCVVWTAFLTCLVVRAPDSLFCMSCGLSSTLRSIIPHATELRNAFISLGNNRFSCIRDTWFILNKKNVSADGRNHDITMSSSCHNYLSLFSFDSNCVVLLYICFLDSFYHHANSGQTRA